MPRPKNPSIDRITIELPKDLSERAKNAVFYTPANVTLKRLAELGVEGGVRILERLYNKGEPFPPRTEQLKGGRPMK